MIIIIQKKKILSLKNSSQHICTIKYYKIHLENPILLSSPRKENEYSC